MPHATAKVNDIVIADTDTYEVVEGNIYVSVEFTSASAIVHSP